MYSTQYKLSTHGCLLFQANDLSKKYAALDRLTYLIKDKDERTFKVLF